MLALSALLADPECPDDHEVSLRLCVSAGDSLSASLQRRFEEKLGTPVLNGFSATEMLHIYLSNTPAETAEGTVGKPVPGFRIRLVDEQNVDVPDGNVGTLLVNGPTAALGYWNQRQQSRDVFLGPWVKTGDRFWRDTDGFYHHARRCVFIGERAVVILAHLHLARHHLGNARSAHTALAGVGQIKPLAQRGI